MRREIESDLPKLGKREYIQGGTIFNGIVAVCDELLGREWLAGARISSFKLEREATANGRLIVSDEPVRDVSANATFLAQLDRRVIHAVFVDEGRAFRREPYEEEKYNQPLRIDSDLSGEFLLPAGRPTADFIKGVVGANKLLHQQTDRFGGELQKIQFLYLKDLAGACVSTAGEEYRLSIANLTIKETPAEVWTINRVAVRGASHASEFRLCYRAQRS